MNNVEVIIIGIVFIVFAVSATMAILESKKGKNRFAEKNYLQIKKLLGEEQEKICSEGIVFRRWEKEGYVLELAFDEADKFLYVKGERFG